MANDLTELDSAAKDAFYEILEAEIRGREDIVYFAEHLLGLKLNYYQRIWLTRTTVPRLTWAMAFSDPTPSPDDFFSGFLFGKNISAVGNQAGKSVAIAIKHLWFCKYKIGMDLDGDAINSAHYSTLNISPHSRQTKAVFSYVDDILHERWLTPGPGGTLEPNRLHDLMKGFFEGSNTTLGEHRFANGSVFYSCPTGQDQASSLQGGQFGYISYDEAPQSRHLQAELGAKIMSRLLKYGACLDLIGTPEVDSPSNQYYYHLVVAGKARKDGWWALTDMGIDDNEFIGASQKSRVLEDIKRTDKKRYAQVVKGTFVTAGARFFNMAEIENMWKLASKIDCVRGRKYLLTADWGMSDDGDPSVFMVFDYTDFMTGGKIRFVNHESVLGGTPQMHFSLCRTLHEQYSYPMDDGVKMVNPRFYMDSANLGGVVIKKLLVNLKPITFDTTTKDDALMETKRIMSVGRSYTMDPEGKVTENNPDYGRIVGYYIEELADQMGFYTVDDRKIKQDFVMAFVMGISYIVKTFRPAPLQKVVFNPLASYNASVKQIKNLR